jgi:hypothetical protein
MRIRDALKWGAFAQQLQFEIDVTELTLIARETEN